MSDSKYYHFDVNIDHCAAISLIGKLSNTIYSPFSKPIRKCFKVNKYLSQESHSGMIKNWWMTKWLRIQLRKELSYEVKQQGRMAPTFESKCHSVVWYTDGCITDKRTGAGVFGPETKYSEPVRTYPSVSQAEINAIATQS